MAFLESTLHVSVPLTDYAQKFIPNQEGYVWSKMLPIKNVRKRTDLIRAFNKGQTLRRWDLRGGSGGSDVQEVQFKMDPNKSFNCQDYAVQAIIRTTERMEADEILMYEKEMFDQAIQAMTTNLEGLVVMDVLRNTSVLTTNTSLTRDYQLDNWFSPLSDPLNTLNAGIWSIRNATTFKPNRVLMHYMTLNQICRHPKVVGLRNVSSTGFITKDELEDMLELDRGTIITTDAQYNAAAMGATDSFKAFIGSDIVMAYAPPPSIRTYGLGSMFMFQDTVVGTEGEAIPEIQAPFVVYTLPDLAGQWDVRGGSYAQRLVGGLDPKVLNPTAGYLIQNAVNGADTARYGSAIIDNPV